MQHASQTAADRLMVQKGKKIDNATMEIGQKKIPVQLECTDAVKLDRFKHENFPYGGVKLSFRFIAMTEEDKSFITTYIANAAISNFSMQKGLAILQNEVLKA